MRAVIAHCWTGSPVDGWYPNASTDLADMGFDVEVPALPDTNGPDPHSWQMALSMAMGAPTPETLLVGHSLGALAALHWLASTPPATSIAGLFLVAPPLEQTGIAEVDRFLQPGPDLDRVRGKARHVAVLVSDRDQYLLPSPQAIAARLALAIDAVVLVAPGRGHFSPASGLRHLPELPEWAAVLLRKHDDGNH